MDIVFSKNGAGHGARGAGRRAQGAGHVTRPVYVYVWRDYCVVRPSPPCSPSQAAEVPRGKPAPDVFLRAAELIGVPPEKCRAYEDGESGIQSAQLTITVA